MIQADLEFDAYEPRFSGPILRALRLPPHLQTIHTVPRTRNPLPASIYEQVDWSANSRLYPLLDRPGGHMGFHDRLNPELSWQHRCMLSFFQQRPLLQGAGDV